MKTRNVNCDILRIFAFLMVISVHFLIYTGFYNVINHGKVMLLLNISRCLFITCVPLFIVLTGYLMKDKELSKDYIKKLSRIIITYILCSIACMLLLHFIDKREVLTLKEYIFQILSFKGAEYSWYVNMYIGLYLIIPFLNILWKNLKTKRQKQYLIFIISILVVLPTLINIYNFDDIKWWLNPASRTTYQQLIPNYWQSGGGYVILYYYIGSYLKEYKLNISFLKNILFLILALIIFGLFNYYRCYNDVFKFAVWNSYPSFEVVIITLLISNLILNFKKITLPQIPSRIIAKISYLTFGAYLLSRIFDIWLYPIIIDKFNLNTMLSKTIYMIPIILTISTCSLLFSYLISIIEKLLVKSYGALKSLFKNKNKQA